MEQLIPQELIDGSLEGSFDVYYAEDLTGAVFTSMMSHVMRRNPDYTFTISDDIGRRLAVVNWQKKTEVRWAKVRIDRKAVADVAERCGLSELLCQGLLNAGWTYVEHISHSPRWERRF